MVESFEPLENRMLSLDTELPIRDPATNKRLATFKVTRNDQYSELPYKVTVYELKGNPKGINYPVRTCNRDEITLVINQYIESQKLN
jgi:hypothetical protein